MKHDRTYARIRHLGTRSRLALAGTLALAFLALSCANRAAGRGEAAPAGSEPLPVADAGDTRDVRAVQSAVPMKSPVTLWEKGKASGFVDAATADAEGYLVIDLGEEWVPYLFSERDDPAAAVQPNAYRATYLALARGEIPNDSHDPYFARRAKRDRYFELYGIAPTLTALRKRFDTIAGLECEKKLDLEPLGQHRGIVGYRDNAKARQEATRFAAAQKRIEAILEKYQVESLDDLTQKPLSKAEHGFVAQYQKTGTAARAVHAAQEKLRCEGYYEGKAKPLPGALDWSTNEALAEFERRHRVFGWGFLSKDTTAALQTPGIELERQAVVRVLTERAMHMAGFVEDGSSAVGGKAKEFRGSDGKEHAVPNLEEQLREAIVEAFGLATPESALAWLKQLGEVPTELLVAIRRPPLPEYYSNNMKLSAEIDRGDVWYEFPYDEKGKERVQPVSRRPHLTLFTEYQGQKIPLLRFNTTIGGWRSESIDGTVMWKYKNSPVGPRVWRDIVASPVWLPPPGTPARDLMKPGPDGPHVNYQEIGPGYASAYGLVAAYHLHYRDKEDGSVDVGGDDGIRTHGSVDYMSILERHSHGCHRLYNHLAVRMMSWILRHRPHHRVGQQKVGFRMPLEHEEKEYVVEVDKGGYVFELDQPVPVNVLSGRILGKRFTPIETPIPKYDDKVGAYVTPEGQAVRVDRVGNVTAAPAPSPDAGAVEQPGASLTTPQPGSATMSAQATP